MQWYLAYKPKGREIEITSITFLVSGPSSMVIVNSRFLEFICHGFGKSFRPQ